MKVSMLSTDVTGDDGSFLPRGCTGLRGTLNEDEALLEKMLPSFRKGMV